MDLLIIFWVPLLAKQRILGTDPGGSKSVDSGEKYGFAEPFSWVRAPAGVSVFEWDRARKE